MEEPHLLAAARYVALNRVRADLAVEIPLAGIACRNIHAALLDTAAGAPGGKDEC